MPEFHLYFNVVCDFWLLCLLAHHETSDDFLTIFTFSCQPNKKVNLINRYNFPAAATNAFLFHGFPIFPKTLPTLSYANFCVPHRKGCHYVAFFCPACLSAFYINPTLTLFHLPLLEPPFQLPTPLLIHHPYFLLPHNLSQSILYKIDAGNVALSCFLRFPDSYAIGSHKNLNALEIARSVVLTNVEDAAR
ncbi:hypothetical protein T02_8795 [Trichinella nativa]|uniref:Uncharacterized protein n=1 Tax=Trichinella nativa TaxID=6335 RepID=A0A0V1LBI9_9BILA|nr:hypothetical protein T02_8795 [Trichinella nativa]